jgi:hypothetical protein
VQRAATFHLGTCAHTHRATKAQRPSKSPTPDPPLSRHPNRDDSGSRCGQDPHCRTHCTLHHLPHLHRPSPLPALTLSSIMASSESNVLGATQQSEAGAAISDPFVDRSTPRHNRGSLAALVAAIQQVSHALPTTHTIENLPARKPESQPASQRASQKAIFPCTLSQSHITPHHHLLSSLSCFHPTVCKKSSGLSRVTYSRAPRSSRHRHPQSWDTDQRLPTQAIRHAAANALTSP